MSEHDPRDFLHPCTGCGAKRPFGPEGHTVDCPVADPMRNEPGFAPRVYSHLFLYGTGKDPGLSTEIPTGGLVTGETYSPERATWDRCRTAPEPATGSAEARVGLLEQALERIRDMEPEQVPEEPEHPVDCPECKRWEGHPVQRGMCDDAYRRLRRMADSRDSAYRAQGPRMRRVAEVALAAAAPERAGSEVDR